MAISLSDNLLTKISNKLQSRHGYSLNEAKNILGDLWWERFEEELIYDILSKKYDTDNPDDINKIVTLIDSICNYGEICDEKPEKEARNPYQYIINLLEDSKDSYLESSKKKHDKIKEIQDKLDQTELEKTLFGLLYSHELVRNMLDSKDETILLSSTLEQLAKDLHLIYPSSQT